MKYCAPLNNASSNQYFGFFPQERITEAILIVLRLQ